MRYLLILVLGAAFFACNRSAPPAETGDASQLCGDARVTGRLPREIEEASGVAVGRRTPGILWVHGDEPEPMLFGIDSTGAIKARVRAAAVSLEDWEDIAAGPCGSQTCLYIGDIGDNEEIRTSGNVYRVVEPALTDSVTERAVRYPFHYADRPHDAESLFVTPDGRMHIVTKGRSGAVTLFSFPPAAAPERDTEIAPTAVLRGSPLKMPDMITGAGATPDGRFVVIRSYNAFQIYHFENGALRALAGGVYDLRELPEGLGEGVDMRNDGAVFLVSEVDTDGRGSPVSRVQCRLPEP